MRVDGVEFAGGSDTARLIHAALDNRLNSPLPHAPQAVGEGNYFEPVLIKIDGIQVLKKEVFGQVRHLAKYKARGPHYLHRFAVERVVSTDTTAAGGNASL